MFLTQTGAQKLNGANDGPTLGSYTEVKGANDGSKHRS